MFGRRISSEENVEDVEERQQQILEEFAQFSPPLQWIGFTEAQIERKQDIRMEALHAAVNANEEIENLRDIPIILECANKFEEYIKYGRPNQDRDV